jgi:hypothetical protein
MMVAQMLLGQPSDRRFLAVARWRLGHLFSQLPSQSRYNERRRQLAPKLVTLWRAIACELPGFHDQLCLVDTTPLPCGQSVQTVNGSELAPWCGFGYSAAHSRFYWGMKLVLVCDPDGCVRDFDLVPANAPEREATLTLLARQPIAGQLVICDKGYAGHDFEQAVRELDALVLPPAPRRRARTRPTGDRLHPATDRVDRQQPERPTAARAPPRKNPGRALGKDHRPRPRALRRNRPQLANRPTTPSPHRLRALTDQASRGPF